MSNSNELRQAAAESPNRDYANVSKMIVEIQKVKHGKNKGTNLAFTAFEFRVEEVLDQKIPRPEGLRRDGKTPLFSQDPVEAGDVQSIYTDFMWDSKKAMVTEAVAGLCGIKAGVPVKNSEQCFENPKTDKMFDDSMGKDKDEFFAGIKAVLDVTPDFKKGEYTGYTSYSMSPLPTKAK